MMINRHPVDSLADVRAQIKDLQAVESALKEKIIASLADSPQRGETQSVLGDEFVASVQLVESERLDRAAVERILAPAEFAKCLKTSMAVTVRVAPRAERVAA